ncbi:hypothetical protein [Tropicimonas sp. IMCC34043]|uniref:hypothetical protein n=1 Tax=Tropicimonas sp. IMCC34043 TaxID=2248760 RepID=UPI000E21FDBD|nr:hypothetical protein [Tropicimonas sp. IMCC34043]
MMSARTPRGAAVLLTAAATLVLGLAVSGCSPVPADQKVALPAGTPKLSASAQRAKQLSASGAASDVPEYTGAPGPDAEFPTYVAQTGKTVYPGWMVKTAR